MHAQEFFSLLLGGLALLLLATALGATVMWRMVHLPRQPPALPVWVSSLLVAGGVLSIGATVIAGQWLGVLSAVLVSLPFVIQLVLSLRASRS
jgi:energy-converting hydrogenase Eha subunit A